LLEQLGGPVAVTRLCRSLGDTVTRLDRWEPELNSAEPWRVTDITTPLAIGTTYARLAVGRALAGADRRRLTGWLLANTTGGERIRAGLPGDWTVDDKTGTGDYGTANDVAIAWPPGRAPVVVAVLSTHTDATAQADSPLVRKAAAVVADAFTGDAAQARSQPEHSRSSSQRRLYAMRPEPFCFDHELSYSDAQFSTERHISFTGSISLPAPRTRPDR
jgi:beta-lactamase class A